MSSASSQLLLSEGLIGAWTLVSVEARQDNGSDSVPFGDNPQGVIIFTPSGHFSLFQSRETLPKLAANDRARATPEEAAAVVEGSIAYHGRYSVDDARRSIAVRLDGSTYANLLGSAQERLVTSLTREELRFANPRTPSGATLLTVWARAR
jgi:hypothetical protein